MQAAPAGSIRYSGLLLRVPGGLAFAGGAIDAPQFRQKAAASPVDAPQHGHSLPPADSAERGEGGGKTGGGTASN